MGAACNCADHKALNMDKTATISQAIPAVCGCVDHKSSSIDKTETIAQPVPEEEQVCARAASMERTPNCNPEDSPCDIMIGGRVVACTGKTSRDACEASSRVFEVRIEKGGFPDTLGMDVKQIDGTLQVLEVLVGGAVHRANLVRSQTDPIGEQILVGDVIKRVNDVSGNDIAMVAECRTADGTLVFQVCRRS